MVRQLLRRIRTPRRGQKQEKSYCDYLKNPLMSPIRRGTKKFVLLIQNYYRFSLNSFDSFVEVGIKLPNFQVPGVGKRNGFELDLNPLPHGQPVQYRVFISEIGTFISQVCNIEQILVAKALYNSKYMSVQLIRFWGNVIFSSPIQYKFLKLLVNNSISKEDIFKNYFVCLLIIALLIIDVLILVRTNTFQPLCYSTYD